MSRGYEFDRLMSEFVDGQELYEKSAIFNVCFHGILAGGSVYKMLEEVIKMNMELSDKMIEIQTLNHFPIVEMKEKTRDEYLADADKLREQYAEDHALCPVCLSEDHTSTLVGYIMDIKQPHLYKDLNNCVCQECGNKHVTHDRLPIGLKSN